MKDVLNFLANFGKRLLRAEFGSSGGLINIVGMVLSFVLVALLVPSDVVSGLVKVFRPKAHFDDTVTQPFVFFLLFSLACAIISERMARRRLMMGQGVPQLPPATERNQRQDQPAVQPELHRAPEAVPNVKPKMKQPAPSRAERRAKGKNQGQRGNPNRRHR